MPSSTLRIATAVMAIAASLTSAQVGAADTHNHAGHAAGHAGHTEAAGHAGHAGHRSPGSAAATPAGPASNAATAAARDTRTLVRYPEPLRVHTLANMRDHLQALGEIQSLLGAGRYDAAADVSERRLGMSSLQLHGAHEVARYMPKGMQDAGTAMHRSASRFAIVAKDASATGDLRPALSALGEVVQTCTACHAGYRLQ